MGTRKNTLKSPLYPSGSLQARQLLLFFELVAQIGHCVKYPENGHRGILLINSECNIEITEGGKSDSLFVKTFHGGDAKYARHFSQRAQSIQVQLQMSFRGLSVLEIIGNISDYLYGIIRSWFCDDDRLFPHKPSSFLM